MDPTDTTGPAALDAFDVPAADATGAAGDRRFAWHPQYRGQRPADVRAQIRDELRSDQRSYALTIDGPPESESDMLVRVMELEKRWGPYAMDWATADLDEIADRAVDFELERDARQELFPYSEYRERHAPVGIRADAARPDDADERPAPWWAFWRR